ncbi:MAG TPA: UvrD-helicase domain-containing protein, partial [Casimicrobium huifangae]|nr:UvrD-helicase domain-containing protein [Casimicrobium huifangae]
MSADADEALIADRRARERVVDPKGSFIVQAPAGSGKTELLVQRLLALLATVDDPAEVLAITFTRKAAQEMRERLIGALEQAAQPAAPSMRPVELARRALALPVLARDQALGWRLREQPDRLVIDTFDAFCARIVARSYLSRVAGEGALGSVTDAAETLYREAATRALGAAEVADAVRGVLTVAGNQVDSVVELLAGLLARRAQWLGAAIDTSPQAIAELTAALRDAADAAMRALVSASDALGRHGNIAELAAYCATVWDRPGSEAKLLDQAEARRQLSAHWPLP